MPEPIGEEFIRIRPDATGFRAELQKQLSGAGLGDQATATKQVSTATRTLSGDTARLSTLNRSAAKSSSQLSKELASTERNVNRYSRGVIAANAASLGFGRALTFASGAFLAGAALGAAIRTATDEFKQATRVQAQTQAVIKATGGAANVTADQVDALSKSLLNVSGVDDEVIKQGANIILTFKGIHDEVGAGNDIFTRATKDVLDISTVFGTDLRSSAVQLGKALQDPAKGLTALRRSGISFSADQQKLIKALVATGQVLTAQKIVLRGVETQVGGTAAAVGRTLPGRLNILRERAKNALGEYVRRISESKKATDTFVSGKNQLGEVASALKEIAQATLSVASSAKSLFGALGGRSLISVFTGAGGLGTIVGAFVAFKAVKIAISLATAAQALYTRSVLVGAGAISVENAALLRNASLARVSAASLAGQTIGSGRAAVSVGSEAASAGRGAAAVGALRIALSRLGGPFGIAAIGAGIAAVAFLKLRRNADGAVGSVKAVSRALAGLSDFQSATQKIADSLAAASENRSIARLNQQQAQRGVAGASAAITGSAAQPGSVEDLANVARLTNAQEALTKANKELAAANVAVRVETEKARVQQQTQAQTVSDAANNLRGALLPEFDRVIARQRLLARIQAQQASDLPNTALARRESPRAAADLDQQLQKLKGHLGELATEGTLVERKVGGALLTLLAQGKKLSATKINLVVSLVGEGKSLDEILNRLRLLSKGIRRQPEGKAFGGATGDTITPLEAEKAAKAELTAALKTLQVRAEIRNTRFEELATARDQVRTAREDLSTAKDAAAQAKQALSDARAAAAESRVSLADTIKSAREQINAAVTDAKGNLDTIGQSLAGLLQQVADKTGTAFGTGGALGKRFRELRAQIIGGQGGPGTQRAAQRIAFELQGKQAKGPDVARQFADLTDQLDRGKLTLPEFNKRLQALLKGLNFSKIRQEFGTKFVNDLLDDVKNLRAQAALILGGPKRPGGGTASPLVRPLQAVAQAGKDIAAARKDVLRADRGIVDAQKQIAKSNADVIDAERKLRTAETKQSKALTVALRAQQRATEANTKVIRARNALDQADPKGKGKGTAGKNAQDNTTAGAGAP